jgi:hypothetical protein
MAAHLIRILESQHRNSLKMYKNTIRRFPALTAKPSPPVSKYGPLSSGGFFAQLRSRASVILSVLRFFELCLIDTACLQGDFGETVAKQYAFTAPDCKDPDRT